MTKQIYWLTWVYVVLLLFEGALRKWVLPGMADVLLIIRDPVVLGIYALALLSGRFPFNGFVIATLALGMASAAASLFAGQDNVLVLAYGLRINYLHLPLIWVWGEFLTRRDAERIGAFLLIMAIPMTLLMVAQFQSPMNAWINRGVGSEEGGQIFGADGRIRPPGFFSFITGPQLFFPLVTAFFLHQVAERRVLWWPLLIAAGLSIVIALPVSISRTAMLATGIVGVVFVGALLLSGRLGAGLMRTLIAGAALVTALSFLPIFGEARSVFLSRWETAAVGSGGDAWGSVFDRVFGGYTQPFYFAGKAPFFGHGVGVGSNVGARLLSGRMGFLLAEEEWAKIFMELGPVLGAAFILLRISVAIHLGARAWWVFRQRREILPLLLFSACGIAIVQYQWAPPTIQGFAMLGGGLLLASLKPWSTEPAPETPTPAPRGPPPIKPYRRARVPEPRRPHS